MKNKFKLNQGFTLVELLIVMAIIAILATMGIMSYKGTLKKTRDSKRMVNIEEIRGALELRRADDGDYPSDLATLVTEKYLKSQPKDPLTKLDYNYSYYSATNDYCVRATVEVPENAKNECNPNPCASPLNYCLSAP